MHTVNEFAAKHNLDIAQMARDTGLTYQGVRRHFRGEIKNPRSFIDRLIVTYGEDARHFFSDIAPVDTDENEARQ
jgi:hypothetical protein